MATLSLLEQPQDKYMSSRFSLNKNSAKRKLNVDKEATVIEQENIWTKEDMSPMILLVTGNCGLQVDVPDKLDVMGFVTLFCTDQIY